MTTKEHAAVIREEVFRSRVSFSRIGADRVARHIQMDATAKVILLLHAVPMDMRADVLRLLEETPLPASEPIFMAMLASVLSDADALVYDAREWVGIRRGDRPGMD